MFTSEYLNYDRDVVGVDYGFWLHNFLWSEKANVVANALNGKSNEIVTCTQYFKSYVIREIKFVKPRE